MAAFIESLPRWVTKELRMMLTHTELTASLETDCHLELVDRSDVPPGHFAVITVPSYRDFDDPEQCRAQWRKKAMPTLFDHEAPVGFLPPEEPLGEGGLRILDDVVREVARRSQAKTN